MNEPEHQSVEQADERYARQVRYSPLGATGQRRLGRSTALLVGCGALGSVLANTLVRAGVGRLRIVDRDFLELSNLQRQVLFDEQDVHDGLPKAVAAQKKLAAVNSQVIVEAVVRDLDHRNVIPLCDGADVILDGTDNFETRFLINDTAHKLQIPWVFGGCVGCDGQTMTIVPGTTPCLNCLMSEGPPPPGTTPTCDTAGILAPIVNVIASFQASEAIKILSGNLPQISRFLTTFELWDNRLRQLDVSALREHVDCPPCKRGEYLWLSGKRSSSTAVLCGRNSVQLSATGADSIDLQSLEKRLAGAGKILRNDYLLRLQTGEYAITVFADGRAIVTGTDQIAKARTLLAQWIGF